MATSELSAADIRAAIAENAKLRARDLAEKLGISEAQLVAADTGRGVMRIAAHPDRLMPAVETLGEVMALTRNASCVHEKVGAYANYHPGEHAAMVLAPQIDLRIFPSWWVTAFAVEKETENGLRRSLQVFDAAGDAVHKIHLREGSDLGAWNRIKAELATGDTSDMQEVAGRTPPEAPKTRTDKRDLLFEEWGKLTDTHQFLRLCSKLRMNRLGAYRMPDNPFVRQLDTSAADRMLQGVRDRGIHFMFFVGNRGCIQIHSGPVGTLKEMGPWQNILDPGFDMHLRRDHLAEVYAVEKPTQRGMALSVEAFDRDGTVIFQAFPMAKEDNDHRPEWRKLVDGLASATAEAAE